MFILFCRWPEPVGGTTFQSSPSFSTRCFLFCGRKIVTCRRCMLYTTVACPFRCGWEWNSPQVSTVRAFDTFLCIFISDLLSRFSFKPAAIRFLWTLCNAYYHFTFVTLYFYLIVFLLFTGGHSTFFALLNTFVHIIMYFYYMVAAMGPEYQKYIWWKKYLTTFQMVRTRINI